MIEFCKKTSITILGIIALSFFPRSALALSRPYSIPCYFEGKVLDFEVTRQNDKYELVVNPTTLSDEDLCDVFQEKTIKGTWYPPTAKLPSGELYKPDQPTIIIEQVLRKGTIIKGYVDSYDSIIEKVEVVKADITDNKEMNQVRQQDNTLDKRRIASAVIGLATILIVGVVYLMWKRFRK